MKQENANRSHIDFVASILANWGNDGVKFAAKI